METAIAILALLRLAFLWKTLPPPARRPWPLRSLYLTSGALMMISATISFFPDQLSQPMAEFLCRSWYVAATATYLSLTVICGPNLKRCTKPLVAIGVIISALLYFTDVFIAGAVTKATSLAWTPLMVTRDPGPLYELWLIFICSMAVLQIALLAARIYAKSDGRDQTAAQWIAAGLATGYVSTGFLAVEMTNPIPAFNAQPLIAVCCIAFCEIISYTYRQRKLQPIHRGAIRTDLALILSIGNVIADTSKTNDDLADTLESAGLLDTDTGPYIERQGQAVFLGDMQRLTWCNKLEAALNKILRDWPTPTVKKFH